MNKFYDFNHLFSNLPYIVFGLAYIVFVRCKSEWHYRRSQTSGLDSTAINTGSQGNQTAGVTETDSSRSKTGIMPQFGIYYALGFALLSQGFLSICYHVCPTSMSLQFDTTPMYIICTLGLVKFYQVTFVF